MDCREKAAFGAVAEGHAFGEDADQARHGIGEQHVAHGEFARADEAAQNCVLRTRGILHPGKQTAEVLDAPRDAERKDLMLRVEQFCIADAAPVFRRIEARGIERLANAEELGLVLAELPFERIVGDVALGGVDEALGGADTVVEALLPEGGDAELLAGERGGPGLEAADGGAKGLDGIGKTRRQPEIEVDVVRHDHVPVEDEAGIEAGDCLEAFENLRAERRKLHLRLDHAAEEIGARRGGDGEEERGPARVVVEGEAAVALDWPLWPGRSPAIRTACSVHRRVLRIGIP